MDARFFRAPPCAFVEASWLSAKSEVSVTSACLMKFVFTLLLSSAAKSSPEIPLEVEFAVPIDGIPAENGEVPLLAPVGVPPVRVVPSVGLTVVGSLDDVDTPVLGTVMVLASYFGKEQASTAQIAAASKETFIRFFMV
jgi:hypothetical protein